MYTERDTKEFILRHMLEFYKGKRNQITYSKLYNVLRRKLEFWEHKVPFNSKDSLRGYLNDLFGADVTPYQPHTLVSTAKGVFVAENKEEIIECAERLRHHALGELKRYAKLMRLPNDYQLLVDLDNLKIREIDRVHQQALFDLDETLYEISKERETDV